MQIAYTIHDEQEYVSGYGQSYLANLGWNRDLVSRISDHRSRVGARITDGVVDIVEKLGLVRLDQEFMEQDVARMDQMRVKLHLYHWLYDCVACLDSVAWLLNSKYDVSDKRWEVAMNPRFIKGLTSKDGIIGVFLSSEYQWMKELKKMRDVIIHGEGRLITGGGSESCYVLDMSRALVRGLPLHRVMVPDMNREYLDKLDRFVESILKTVDTW